MNIHPAKLGYELAKQFMSLLNENVQPIVVYVGRFQPFHAAHYKAYEYLVKKFGKDRVYIATSNKTEPGKSPFDFNDKQQIMSTMFGIDPTHIVQCKNPYAPAEILQNVDSNTPLIVGLGEKDAERLTQGKYYRPYKDGTEQEMLAYQHQGYVEHVPTFKMNVGGKEISSATEIRDVFTSGDEASKKDLFTKLYGRFDSKIYNLIDSKIKESGTIQIVPQKIKKSIATKTPLMPTKDSINQFLNVRIKNPETGKDILIKSALGYDEIHPVHKAAMDYIQSHSKNEGLVLLEGGGAGHMSHPYEDMDLTFGDLKELTRRALIGGLDKEGPVSEKVDGQNLLFSVKDDKVIFARSKGQLKNFGSNAMSADELRQKFAGRGNIEQSFGLAGEDLQKAISSLPRDQQRQMFGDGRKFMNIEIIHPDAKNAINYTKPILMFHGSIEVDQEGDEIGRNVEDGEVLTKSLQRLNAARQQTYGIRGAHFVIFSDNNKDEYARKAKEYIGEFQKVEQEAGLNDTNTIGQFLATRWQKYLEKSGIQLSTDEQNGIIRRWVYGDKSFGSKHLPPEKRVWFREMDAKARVMNDKFAYPVKIPILKMGADSIERISDVLASNNPLAAQELRIEVDKAISDVRLSANPDKIVELERHLEVLSAIGNDKISASEGLVFNYKGGIYKLTGAFAPANRILSLMKYAQQEPQEPVQQQSPIEPKQAPPQVAQSKQIQYTRPMGDIMDKTIINPITKNKILVRTAMGYPVEHPARKLAQQMIEQ